MFVLSSPNQKNLKRLEVATSNLLKWRSSAQSWDSCMPIWHPLVISICTYHRNLKEPQGTKKYYTKGQLFSEWIYVVIVSSKIWMKNFKDIYPEVYRAEILTVFCSYFGRNDNFINSFWNLLTFSIFWNGIKR